MSSGDGNRRFSSELETSGAVDAIAASVAASERMRVGRGWLALLYGCDAASRLGSCLRIQKSVGHVAAK